MRLSLKEFVFAEWKWVLGILIIFAAGGYLYFGRGNDLGATMTVSPHDVREQVSVSGTVTAAQDVSLGFASNGRIARTYAKVGQYVSTGTILAETENGDLAAALAEAQANLASLIVGTRPEELAVAQTAVVNAQAALVDAIQNAYTTADDAVHNKADAFFTNPRTNPKLSFTVANASLQNSVERNRASVEPVLASLALLVAKLTNDNVAVSEKQAQVYLAQVVSLLADANDTLNQGVPDQTTSAATLASYKTTLATARTNLNTAATAVTSAAAALDAAQSTLALKNAGSTNETVAAQRAKVENARAALAKTRVIAPFSGTITRMDAKVGEIVSPSVSEIAMQSDGVFQIETFIPEVAIARIAVGNPATTTLDAYGATEPFAAMVVSVDPAETVKEGVPTYKTTLTFLARDSRIRSGMTADVVIETGILHDAFVIPSGAVGTSPAGPYVTVVVNDAPINRSVETGVAPSLGKIEILSGLSAGDMILLTPAAP